MYTCIHYVCVYIYIYIYVCVCVCVCVCVYVRTNVCIHAYTMYVCECSIIIQTLYYILWYPSNFICRLTVCCNYLCVSELHWNCLICVLDINMLISNMVNCTKWKFDFTLLSITDLAINAKDRKKIFLNPRFTCTCLSA